LTDYFCIKITEKEISSAEKGEREIERQIKSEKDR
jgi:hypothetical protein